MANVVGFAGAVGTPVPIGATYIYNLNFFCGFIVASLMYYVLCWISPVPATSQHWLEAPLDDADFEDGGWNSSFVYGVAVDDLKGDSGRDTQTEDFKVPKISEEA